MGEQAAKRVRRVVEHELAAIDSPETAQAVLERAEQLAAGATEQQEAERAAAEPETGDRAVVKAARAAPPGPDEAAATLVETAAQAVAPTPEAPAIVSGAQAALSATTPSPPAAERGRVLLQEAALRRMGPRDSLDARIFLALNGSPHPRWLDRSTHVVTFAFRGGWIWLGALAAARLLGLVSGPGMVEGAACVFGTTFIAEYPIKAFFRRRRPFVDVIRATVVGKKPGSWSFPSGHTAASFAGAAVLSAAAPRFAPAFFALAGMVGASRVYAGAHYPGDVLSGAFFGVTIAGLIRTVARAIPSRAGF